MRPDLADNAGVPDNVLYFAAAIALVFTINLVPALMPATWMVLAFFHIHGE